MRKKDEALRQNLLNHARAILEKEGPQAVNIRAIAQKTGIATGTVYNYFAGKDDILLALTESYWAQTLQEMDKILTEDSFASQLERLYDFLKGKIEDSGGMLMRSNQAEGAGRKRMQAMLGLLQEKIIRLMEQDAGIKPSLWTERFTPERYANFIVLNIMTALRSGAQEIDILLEILRRTIYLERGEKR